MVAQGVGCCSYMAGGEGIAMILPGNQVESSFSLPSRVLQHKQKKYYPMYLFPMYHNRLARNMLEV